jgi:hypothetical protein
MTAMDEERIRPVTMNESAGRFKDVLGEIVRQSKVEFSHDEE